MNSVVKIRFGSHLYGTNTPESDVDFKYVHIPSAKDILLQRVQDSIKTGRSKEEGEKNQPGDVDAESYSLQRYLNLLAEGQTVALDMLFAPDSSLLYASPLWRHIQNNSHRLLTKKSAAFLGYCRQQANKYGIKGSRVDSVKTASAFFTNAVSVYGPTHKVGAVPMLRSLQDEHTRIFTTFDVREESYFECCNRKVPLTASIKLASEIYTRVYESYGDRARKAQSNEGVDWKALSHAVRVGHEALELLDTGRITLPLPIAPHLLDIKQGRLPYQEVSGEIERLLESVEKAAETSTLPDEVDQPFIDDLVSGEYMVAVSKYKGAARRLQPAHAWRIS
jgi:hypothetical protein